jgi:hypothetical protein
VLIYYTFDQTVYISSSKFKTVYPVHAGSHDYEDAADLIATIDQNLIKLMSHLKSQYSGDAVVRNLLERYNPDKIGEVAYNNMFGRTSYTINKGEAMWYCLRSKKGILHDENTIMFVALHELAHIGDWNYNHTDSFWSVFKFLLINAVVIGIYTPVHYEVEPMEYCGMHVNYNPLFDANLHAYTPETKN